jgi:alanyl-tRNA synthetase
MHERLAVLERLAQAMSAPWTDLPDQAVRVMDEKGALAKENQELRERALEGEAHRLLADHPESPAVVALAFEGRDGAELRGLADRIVKARPAVALLAGRGERVQLVFARSAGLAHDMNALLKSVLAEHGGRGGGRPEMAQGGCDRIEDLEGLLRRLASGLGAPA